MLITKIKHCCFKFEYKKRIIIADPGIFCVEEEIGHVDIIIYTHIHGDHWNEEVFEKLLTINPNIKIITNSEVHEAIENVDFISKYEAEIFVIEDGQEKEIDGINFSGHGKRHAEIYKEYGQVMNTGYCIDEKVFFPGDAFTVIDKKVDVLFVDVVGPFCSLRDAVNYTNEMSPTMAIPMHEEVCSEGMKESVFKHFAKNIDKTVRCVAVIPGGQVSVLGK